MKHLFHVFDYALKIFGRDKRFDFHHFLVFSCHEQILELVFHTLLPRLVWDNKNSFLDFKWLVSCGLDYGECF